MKKFGRFYAVLLLISLITQSTYSAKILILAPASGKSNRITYLPLIEELGKRGHNVTVLSPHAASPPMKNVKEIVTIPWKEMDERIEKDLKFSPFKDKAEGKNFDLFTVMNLLDGLCKEAIALPQSLEILKETFDLIIMQAYFNNCALGYIYRLKSPFILVSPVEASPLQIGQLGGHIPPSYYPLRFMGIPEEMGFLERFKNVGFYALFWTVQNFISEPKATGMYRELMGDDIPPAGEILANASLIFTNTHFSLSKPKPYLPNVVETGGLHSFVKPKPLPKDIAEFIEGGKKGEGFIFFSMGSNIKATDMPEDKRKMFLKVFSKLKQQVLWKWESEEMPDLPKNVKLSKWLPQQDLLAREDIKMFITHCGGGSTEESIYNGVPILGFPMFADQPLNAMTAEGLGMIVQLDWNTATEETLMEAIQELLNNPKYKENAKRISGIYRDQPQGPLERAVYWTEYVIRHKGAPHLRPAGIQLNWFQYHSYDVILTYLGLIGGVLYLICTVLKWIGRKACGCGGSKTGKKAKRE